MSNIDPSLVIPYFKRVGQTPLDCVEEYRVRTSLSSSEIISYAGRLDPMAEGVLLLLRGEANKHRRHFEHLSKQYEVMVLCGFVTDTGDLMGIVTEVQSSNFKSQNQIQNSKEIKNVIPLFIGNTQQYYPPYSSVKVKGRPLYWWARQGRLSEIEIPHHQVNIDSITVTESKLVQSRELLEYITSSIRSVRGDFRQQDIISGWQDALSNAQITTSHPLIRLSVDCGSGVYMRQLVQDLGEKLLVPMCAHSIRRTRVGDFSISDCMNAHEPQASTAF